MDEHTIGTAEVVNTVQDDLRSEVQSLTAEVARLHGIVQGHRDDNHRLRTRLAKVDEVEVLTDILRTIDGVTGVTIEQDTLGGQVAITLDGVRLDDDEAAIVPLARSYLVTMTVPMAVTIEVEVEEATDDEDASEQATDRVESERWSFEVDCPYQATNVEVDVYSIDIETVDVND